MTAADLPEVVALAAAIHPGYPESPAVFAERLALAPGFCRMLPAQGYAIAHPWSGPAPPLDSLLGRLPERPEALHLHDIALAPAARGSGLARAVVLALLADAATQGLPRATLIAVAGKAGYWAALGFRPASGPAPSGYGADALPMARPLSRSAP